MICSVAENHSEVTTIRSGGEFTIWGIRKRSKSNPGQSSHLYYRKTGTAKLQITNSSFGGGVVEMAKTAVEFNGMKYPLLHVRGGLGDNCLVITIAVKDGEFSEWDLYTNTPNPLPGGKHPPQEELEKQIAEKIKSDNERERRRA